MRNNVKRKEWWIGKEKQINEERAKQKNSKSKS